MIGHSVGEYVAATLAGVISLEDALAVIARRGRLISALPRGSMLAVLAAAENLKRSYPKRFRLQQAMRRASVYYRVPRGD